MSGYVKLFSQILDSTVWTMENKETKLVWITMLAMKSRNQIVESSIPGLARRAGVSIEECEFALRRFKEPDKYSNSPEEEGRRIKDVPGGWLIVNGQQYRDRMSLEDRREYKRQWQAKKRAVEKSSTEPVAKDQKPEKVWDPTPEQIRLGAIMGREPTTPWKPDHLKAWKAAAPIDEEDLKKLERYYRYRGAGEREMWKKTKFDTLMSDLTCQIEKARKWREPSSV